jgi:hypothetical protein
VGLLVSCCIALLVSIVLVEVAGPFSDWLLLGASVLFVCTYNCILLTSSTIFVRTNKLEPLAHSHGPAPQARPSVVRTPHSSTDSRSNSKRGTPRGSVSVRLEDTSATGLDDSSLMRQDSSVSLLGGASPSESLYELALDDSNGR